MGFTVLSGSSTLGIDKAIPIFFRLQSSFLNGRSVTKCIKIERKKRERTKENCNPGLSLKYYLHGQKYRKKIKHDGVGLRRKYLIESAKFTLLVSVCKYNRVVFNERILRNST